jgi:hypothetical protein
VEKRARYLLTGLRSMLDQETSNEDVAIVAARRQAPTQAPSVDELHQEAKDPTRTSEAATQVMSPEMTVQPGNLTLGLFGSPADPLPAGPSAPPTHGAQPAVHPAQALRPSGPKPQT